MKFRLDWNLSLEDGNDKRDDSEIDELIFTFIPWKSLVSNFQHFWIHICWEVMSFIGLLTEVGSMMKRDWNPSRMKQEKCWHKIPKSAQKKNKKIRGVTETEKWMTKKWIIVTQKNIYETLWHWYVSFYLKWNVWPFMIPCACVCVCFFPLFFQTLGTIKCLLSYLRYVGGLSPRSASFVLGVVGFDGKYFYCFKIKPSPAFFFPLCVCRVSCVVCCVSD